MGTTNRQKPYTDALSSGEKKCIRCGIIKQLDEFPPGRTKRNGSPRYAYCKSCHREYQYERRLATVFLITPKQYNEIVEYQNAQCAICGCSSPPFPRRLSLDHRHSDGLIRGILCNMCNRALARWREKTDVMQKAIEYLLNPPAIKALGQPTYGLPGRAGTKKQRKLGAKIRKQKQEGEPI